MSSLETEYFKKKLLKKMNNKQKSDKKSTDINNKIDKSKNTENIHI